MPFRPLRGRDLALHAAAVTFYGGIAVVPVALLAIWITGLVAGADRVRRLTGHTIDALPDAIGAPHALAALIDAGLQPHARLRAGQPAARHPVRRGPAPRLRLAARAGRAAWSAGGAGCSGCRCWPPRRPCCWRCFWRLPVTSGLWVRGGWYAVLGVVLSFLAAWLVLTPVRDLGLPGRRAGPPALAGHGAGRLVHRREPLRLPARLRAVLLAAARPGRARSAASPRSAAVVAVGLWLYLFHVIVLAGLRRHPRARAR